MVDDATSPTVPFHPQAHHINRRRVRSNEDRCGMIAATITVSWSGLRLDGRHQAVRQLLAVLS